MKDRPVIPTFTTIKFLLKRIIIALFTNNPYRLENFKNLYKEPNGLPVNRPEQLNYTLLKQKGATFSYQKSPSSQPDVALHRSINNQPRYLPTGLFKEPDRVVYSISNAAVWSQLGLVYDIKERAFINESAKDWVTDLRISPLTTAFHLPKPTRLTGLTLSCLTVGADGGFYHFFYEAITKLYIYQPFISQAQQIIFNGPVTNWKLKWLQLAKVDSSKVIWMENQGHYVAEQLLFTNRLVADQQINPWSIYALRSLFNVPVACSFTHPSGILWLTRKNVQARNIVWEDKLLSLFPAINSVVLEDMSIEQTIAMFRSAQIVIAPHGASLSNILFCNTGTKVLELYDKGTYFQPCYFRLSELCKLRHEIAYLNFNNADDEVYGLTLAKKLITNLLQNA